MFSISLLKVPYVREFPAIHPPASTIQSAAPNILDMTLGRFFIKSSGEVNGIASP
jgi:hypothetical protein